MDDKMNKKVEIFNGIKFLGIDYGTKRIGLAVSDEGGILAFPKRIISNDLDCFKKLDEVIKTEKISEIVIGESTDFSGKLNILSAEIEIFVSKLKKKFNLPIHRQKEFLTSVEARRYKNFGGRARKSGNNKKELNASQVHNRIKKPRNKSVDASAAALVLQRYLDRKNLRIN